MTDTTLGQRIAQRRRMLSLSQEAFGEKMSVSRQAISKWEADAAIPEVDRLIEMSRLFGVSVGWLLGTETEPAAEAAAPDLTDTIAQALAPAPPEPQPPAAPTPPPAPPSVPVAQPRRWLLPVCAAVTAASLILSAISLSVAMTPQQVPTPTTDPTLSARLDDMSDQMIALESDLERAHTRLDGMWDENLKLSLRLHDLEESGSTSTTPTPVIPGDDAQEPSTEPSLIPDGLLIQDSSLTSCLYLYDEEAALIFSCTAREPLESMALVALALNGDVFTAVCGGQDDKWTGELRVPLKDGYNYYLKLRTAAGEEKTVSLTGHGLQDLYSGYLRPQIEASPKETPFGNHSAERFWAGYDGVLLTPPPLTPPTSAPVWEIEMVEYWYNDTYVSNIPLTDLLTDEQRTSPSVNFSLPTLTFDLAGMEEGDTHQLRLMVQMDFGDAIYSSTQELSTWIVKNGKLVLQ